MQSSISTKRRLRRVILRRRRRLSQTEVGRCSRAVCQRLAVLAEVRRVPLVAVYAATPDEVDLEDLVSTCRGRQQDILLPRFEERTGRYTMVRVCEWHDETCAGKFGILEPLPHLAALSEVARRGASIAWIIPGLAFDPSGNRLGLGGGYYDRLLEGADGCKIGVAFDWQIRRRLPRMAHDIRMEIVVSEERLLRCDGR